MVDIILLERVENLGQMGQVVKVKPGFARNFLLPQRKALRATKENLKYFESQRAQLEANNLRLRGEAEVVAKQMDGIKVVVVRQAAETGVLYGSVSGRDISESITEAGFTVQRRQVVLDIPIKTLGLHTVKVILHPEVSIQVVVNVAQSAEEAAAQLRRLEGETVVAEEEAVEETAPETEETDA